MAAGTLVISLDFELFWGMTDVTTLEEYGANVRGVREAIPGILALFAKYDIHATWAVVGMLTPPTKTELFASFPLQQPAYQNMRYSNYAYAKSADIGADEEHDPYHFGASLLRLIQKTPHQEVGSHTFSHYYCTEKGQTATDFEADMRALEASFKPFGITPTSLVFPRNQWREEYLELLRVHGYTAFRGNQHGWVYASRPRGSESVLLRIVRLLDAYVPVFGHHTYGVAVLRRASLPHNVPASFFFRPYSSTLAFLESVRLTRMMRAMTHAAKTGELVHLWWHPHNFGTHTKQNLANLEGVLKHFVKLQNEFGMESKTMREVAMAL